MIDFLNAFVVVNPANILSKIPISHCMHLYFKIFWRTVIYQEEWAMKVVTGQSHDTTRQDDEHETCVIVTKSIGAKGNIFLRADEL